MSALSASNENYLKAIFDLTHRGAPVTTGSLATELGVSSPSATAMLKRLEQTDLVERPDARRVRLTAHGERAALQVVRRHRLLETFLARVVDVPWDEVHAEAEVLEHALSDRLEQRIDALLGHPDRDPHGDPIPPRDGTHQEAWGDPLSAAKPGQRFRVERVSDRDSDALRYLGGLGVLPGADLAIDEVSPFGGPIWVVLPGGDRHALGAPLTRMVHGRISGPAVTDDAGPA
ncbi:DtxR family iron (metal) dependent repressor [Pseudonocardia sediminis]|uniref:Manganese transport regulator n=1 Tax=Pseudonocardia sediminis TaxID=1397368 RepID=A0A4Q7UTJ8_PSEST|nr:metal-dependent transcriptional regulator [Pseudonocardia sediminis]RZT85055.1 DtxR family iron (metal) dependent repressor [Pseudonocardia sediminis]